MVALTPASDFAAYLRAQLTNEPVIFVQGLPAAPDDVIAVLVAGSGEQALSMGMVVIAQTFAVQVIVRGSHERGRETEALMQTVHAELQALADVSMDGTTYALVTAESEPAYLNTDLEGRPLWVGNYAVTHAEGP